MLSVMFYRISCTKVYYLLSKKHFSEVCITRSKFILVLFRSEPLSTNLTESRRLKSHLNSLHNDLIHSHMASEKRLVVMEHSVHELQSKVVQMDERFNKWFKNMKKVTLFIFLFTILNFSIHHAGQ